VANEPHLGIGVVFWCMWSTFATAEVEAETAAAAAAASSNQASATD